MEVAGSQRRSSLGLRARVSVRRDCLGPGDDGLGPRGIAVSIQPAGVFQSGVWRAESRGGVGPVGGGVRRSADARSAPGAGAADAHARPPLLAQPAQRWGARDR
eukprot:1622884-Rhodomonas_salina.2